MRCRTEAQFGQYLSIRLFFLKLNCIYCTCRSKLQVYTVGPRWESIDLRMLKHSMKANRTLEASFAENYSEKTTYPLATIDKSTGRAIPVALLNKSLSAIRGTETASSAAYRSRRLLPSSASSSHTRHWSRRYWSTTATSQVISASVYTLGELIGAGNPISLRTSQISLFLS